MHEGDVVEPDQVLMELWNDDLAAGVLHARQEAVAAAAKAEEACVVAEVAEREAQRLSKLHRQRQVSETELDQSVGDAKAKRAGCNAARASTEVSAAQLDVALAKLERTVLRAPFAGTVAEVNGELGEVVTPSPIGVATPPAVDLIDHSCLYVTAPIDEVDAPAIRAGMTARIALDAFPDRDFPGTVRRVAPYVLDIEKQARTVEIEAEFSDLSGINNMLPGYSADIEVVLATKPDILRVPTEAVLEGNRVLVYLADAEELEARDIQTGISNWAHTEVLSGLEAGERVVTSVDREGVAAGVRVVPEEEAASD